VFRRRTEDDQAATKLVTKPSGRPVPAATSAADPGDEGGSEGARRDPQAPKGRPTPKRSEAQTRRRTAVTTPTDRKAAAKQAREARRSQLARQREALAGGDERYLPARDRGPVRRFARDWIDSRYRLAEYFLPLSVLILILAITPNATIKSLSTLVWLAVMLLIVVDGVFAGLRLRRDLAARFPDKEKERRGVVMYAMMRSLQPRRMRMPKPRVKRGEKP
jgi:hypothetical protein